MYGIDIRRLAIKLYHRIGSFRKTAILTDISRSSLQRWMHCVDRKPYKHRKCCKSDVMIEAVKSCIEANPFVSVHVLKMKINDCFQVNVSTELVRTAIKKKLGYTRKKACRTCKPSHLPSKTAEFLAKRKEYLEQGRPFVSIDETSFGRNGVQSYGYAPRGTKLFVERPMKSLKNTSVVVCVDANGIIGRKAVLGAFNRYSFVEFLQELQLPKNCVVMMDNVSFHHSKCVKDHFHDHGIDILYVPPYSPWFNPIELCFSVIKRKYYSTMSMDASFAELTQEHCTSFFRKSLSAIAPF